MDVTLIDYYANHGTSFLHRAGAYSKILFVTLLVASVIITREFYMLLGIYVTLLILALWTRLPLLKIIAISIYPTIFTLLFVIASWDGSWLKAGVVMLKALSAALTMVILISTTPYPDVFNVVRPLLPGIIAEGLFIAYRSLFILLKLTDDLIKGLSIRGGLKKRRYANNIKNFSSGISLLLVRGFDMSEKLYGVMNLRGYKGEARMVKQDIKASGGDLILISIGVSILAASLGIRIESGLATYSTHFLALCTTILATSAIYLIQSEL